MANAQEAYKHIQDALDTGRAQTLPLILFAVNADGSVSLMTNVPTNLFPQVEAIVLEALKTAKARYAN